MLNLMSPSVTKSYVKIQGQPGQMGVAHWTHKECKEFGGSNQKFFDHHAFYVGYNVMNVFFSAIKAEIRV